MATTSGSNPPSSLRRSARTRVKPPGATKTSRTASCWPASISPACTRSTTAPHLSALSPTCSRTSGSSQVTILGQTIPAFERNDSSTSTWRASGSGAQSSWQSRKYDAPSTMPTASSTAAPKPRSSSRRRT